MQLGFLFDAIGHHHVVELRLMNNVHQVWEYKVTAGGVEHVFVWIPLGRFLMGSPEGEGDDNEHPQHEVEITKGFWMGKYPVTICQYMAFCHDTDRNWPEWLEIGSDYNINTGSDEFYRRHVSEDPGDKRPIVGVSWEDAVVFCEWMSSESGGEIRLPTEAEWEYACRAGSTGEIYGDLDRIAWYAENAEGRTHPVGEKEPNIWGLYDILGNVWEWCHDWYNAEYYDGSPLVDPDGPDKGALRVYRGGSWSRSARFCRSAFRSNDTPDFRRSDLGFRLALSPRSVR